MPVIYPMLCRVLLTALVALRVLHSLIHISCNHPLHRFLVFLVSSVIVLLMGVLVVPGL